MITTLTWGLCALSGVVIVLAAVYAHRDRLIDDALLGLLALLEIGVVVQLVHGLSRLADIADADERLTLLAYLVSLPIVPVGTGFLAIKEKTRWSMATIAVGAFAVGVMTLRCQQIWDAHGAAHA